MILAPLVTWAVLGVIRHLPTSLRARQLGRSAARPHGRTAEEILDLAEDVDDSRDHIRGSADAPVTLAEPTISGLAISNDLPEAPLKPPPTLVDHIPCALDTPRAASRATR